MLLNNHIIDKFRIIILLVILIFQTSCNSNDNFFEFYKTFADTVPDSLLTDIPNIGDNTQNKLKYKLLSVYYPIVLQEQVFNYCGLFFETRGEKIDIERIVNKFSQKAIYNSNLSDSLLIKLPFVEKLVISDKSRFDNNVYIIPDLNKRHSPLKSLVISQNTRLIILENKPGKFLADNFMHKNLNMPEKFSNGYSKGIIYNEENNYFVYWLMIW